MQAYALNNYIRNLGFDANTIFYDLSRGNKVSLLIKLKINLIKIFYFLSINRRNREFNEFIKKRIKLLDNGKIYGNERELINKKWNNDDIFIVGSDQCWCDISRNEFFLNFAGDCKKIAYAVSMGDGLIEDQIKIKIQEKTKKFDGISVREQYHQQQFNYKFSLCIDPVFLISMDEWRAMANVKNNLNIPKSYIFVYTIYGSKQMSDFLYILKKQTGLPIILVGGVKKKINLSGITFMRGVGIEEWLSLINKATYVVTDSFHATAFSVIFEKNVYPFSKNNYSRIDNMLKYFGLENIAIHPNVIPQTERKIDYYEVKKYMNSKDGIINYSKIWIKEKICKN